MQFKSLRLLQQKQFAVKVEHFMENTLSYVPLLHGDTFMCIQSRETASATTTNTVGLKVVH